MSLAAFEEQKHQEGYLPFSFVVLFAHLYFLRQTHTSFQGISTPLFAGTQCESFCDNSEITDATVPRRGKNLTSMHQIIIQPSSISEQTGPTCSQPRTDYRKLSFRGTLRGLSGQQITEDHFLLQLKH